MRVSQPERMFALSLPFIELPIGGPVNRENPWLHPGNTAR